MGMGRVIKIVRIAYSRCYLKEVEKVELGMMLIGLGIAKIAINYGTEQCFGETVIHGLEVMQVLIRSCMSYLSKFLLGCCAVCHSFVHTLLQRLQLSLQILPQINSKNTKIYTHTPHTHAHANN